VLENGAGAQQPDRRGGQEQRAVHPPGVRGGRRGDVRRGRLQAPRVRAPQTFHARHTQAGPQVLRVLVVAHRRSLQGPIHVGPAVGVFRRPAGNRNAARVPRTSRERAEKRVLYLNTRTYYRFPLLNSPRFTDRFTLGFDFRLPTTSYLTKY